MNEEPQATNLPAQIADAVAGVPKALVPASIKALDRLLGASVDIPVAWLAQKKAKIDAQTEAYKLVEASIAKAAANQAGAYQATIERAVDVLVRKAYRKQENREAVAAAMIEDLREQPATPEPQPSITNAPIADLDEDWLNVFERYAEDASSERMQRLWGRVIAGEVRKPGRFSMRTLRFLSEFSQADAITFSSFCDNASGYIAPASLVKPASLGDEKHLIWLESSGLVQGATGLGLKVSYTFDERGNAFIAEDNLVVMLQGEIGSTVTASILALTPLGQELIALIPQRDARAAARRVMAAMRTPEIKGAYLGVLGSRGEVLPFEVLWQPEIAPLPQ